MRIEQPKNYRRSVDEVVSDMLDMLDQRFVFWLKHTRASAADQVEIGQQLLKLREAFIAADLGETFIDLRTLDQLAAAAKISRRQMKRRLKEHNILPLVVHPVQLYDANAIDPAALSKEIYKAIRSFMPAP
jgi:hypothetical protein